MSLPGFAYDLQMFRYIVPLKSVSVRRKLWALS